MFNPKYCNCLIFAVVNKLISGGNVIAYRLFPWPHFMWRDAHGKTWSYTSSPISEEESFNILGLIFRGTAVRRCFK